MMLTIMNISIAVSPSAFGAKINANITDKDLWDVAGDAVEDVDEDEEDGHQDRHPSRHALRRNKEAEER